MKMIFIDTPHNSFRANISFDDSTEQIAFVYTERYNRFAITSIWGGADKVDNKFISFEFDRTLVEYYRKLYPTSIATWDF